MSDALRQHAARAVEDLDRKSLFAIPARKVEPWSAEPPDSRADHPHDTTWLWPGWLRRGRMHLLLAASFAPKHAVLRDLADRLGRGCPPRNTASGKGSSSRPTHPPCRVLLAFEHDQPPERSGTWAEAEHLAEVYVQVHEALIRGFDPTQDREALIAFQKQFHYDLLVLPMALDQLTGPVAAERLRRVRRVAAAASITPMIVTAPRQNARRRFDAPLRLNDLPHVNRLSEQVDTIIALSGGMRDAAGQPVDCGWHHLHHPFGPTRALTVRPEPGGGLTWKPIDPAEVGRAARVTENRVTASAASIARAVGFLEAALDQPQPRNELFARARSAGIGTRALWAAARQLGIRSHRVGFGAEGCHYWTRAA